MRSPPQLLRVVWRDLSVEALGGEAAIVVLPFIVVAVLLAGLGFGPRPDVLITIAPGLSWFIVLMAAVPLARTVAAAESEDGCWDLLRALVSPSALLGGKVITLWLWLSVTWFVSALLVALVFSAPLPAGAVLGGLLGTLGFSALVVMFGFVGVEQRNGLLAILLLPAGLPALLAGTQVSAPGTALSPWLGLLAAYDIVSLVLTWALFPILLEE